MVSAARTIAFQMVSAVVSGVWTYRWPYGEGRTCECYDFEPTLDNYDDALPTFPTEVECLRDFAANNFEFCKYEDAAVVAMQCVYAIGYPNVDAAQEPDNPFCIGDCLKLVAGNFSEYQEEFFTRCRFDFPSRFGVVQGFLANLEEDDCEDKNGYTVAVLPDSCFSNYVWGFSNYDPSNAAHVSKTKYFQDVPSHVACQTLCQQVDDCAFFSWRAYPDLEARENGMQNPMNSCILYNQDFMDEITAFVVEDTFPPTQSDLCDMEQAALCTTLPWEDNKFSLFSDYPCQTCDCQARCSWESPVHITGPAYCEKDVKETCTFHRPTFTTTLPPCEPLDDRTTAPEEGTAETDTALYTEPARGVDAETTNIIFSQGERNANELEGTAEADFALPTETTIEMTTVELSSESTIELRQV